MTLQYNVSPQPAAPAGNTWSLSSLFGNVAVGRDMSGNFAMSAYGVAVSRGDGSYVTLDADRDRLVDATMLVLPNMDPWVVRVPAPPDLLQRGDLVIISDTPFRALYVLRREGEDRIFALDPITEQVVVFAPLLNLFVNVCVVAVSLFDMLGVSLERGPEDGDGDRDEDDDEPAVERGG